MATVRHAKVSAIADVPAAVAAGEVVPSDWNDDHVVTLVDADIPAGIARDVEVTTAIAALSTVYQPLDSDLTAIAALTTTAYGRALLALADAAAARSALGLGTAAQSATGDFDAAGAAAVAAAVSQPLDGDLTAIAALSTTAFGRSLLAAANASALRTLAGTVIGTDVPALGSTVMDGDAAGGDLSGTYPNPSVTNDSHSHTAATLPAAGADLSAVDFLVGTASGLLSAEIVVGPAPGGELGGTWDSPTVDATHSGSTHAAAQAAAEATAAGALSTHAGAADPHPGYLTSAEGDAAYEASGAVATHDADTTAVHGIADTSTLYRAGGTDVPIADGGTGASTKAAAFDALSPMTAAGDIVIGGAAGTGTRLAVGATSGQVLTSNGPAAAPSYQTPGLLDIWVGAIPPYMADSAGVMNANQGYWCVFQVNRPKVVSQVTYRVGVASGSLDIGIYAAIAGGTHALLGSTGSFATGATGANRTRALTASVTLVPGLKYYQAVAADNPTVSFYVMSTGGVPIVGDTSWLFQAASVFPLPSSVTPAAAVGVRIPWVDFS